MVSRSQLGDSLALYPSFSLRCWCGVFKEDSLRAATRGASKVPAESVAATPMASASWMPFKSVEVGADSKRGLATILQPPRLPDVYRDLRHLNRVDTTLPNVASPMSAHLPRITSTTSWFQRQKASRTLKSHSCVCSHQCFTHPGRT